MSGEKEAGKGESDSSKDITEALKSLIARIGDIFGVFDLSFFVAGAVCLGALVFGTYIGIGDKLFEHVNLKELSGLEIAAIIIACYVLGLVCFAIGRAIHWRIWSRCDFYAELPGQLQAFGLSGRYFKEGNAPIEVDKKQPHGAWVRASEVLYTRLWAEARQSKELAPSFNLLMRYWVMSAMCDGLAVALCVWSLVWATWSIPLLGGGLEIQPPSILVRIVVGVVLLLGVRFCLTEGKRYGSYQMSELLASLAQLPAPAEVAPQDAQRHVPPPSLGQPPGAVSGTPAIVTLQIVPSHLPGNPTA